MKNSFIIYTDFYDPICELTDEQLGKLFRAVFEYHINGVTDVDPEIRIPFRFFRNQFAIDQKKYDRRVETARQNGSKGGRPKKPNETQKTERVSVEPKKPVNVNVTVNDNENVNENVNENENVILPFDSDLFRDVWGKWKQYKKQEHGFKYKSITSEQTALKKLNQLSRGDEQTACLILEQSVENGWKGFFELRKSSEINGNDIDQDYLNELKSRLK